MLEVQIPTTQKPRTSGIWNGWFHFIPPKVNLVVRHDLRSADIQVFMDGKSIYVDRVVSSPKKFFGVIGKKGSSFSKSLAVPAGSHIVQVHLASAEDRFDQTAQQQLNLVRASMPSETECQS